MDLEDGSGEGQKLRRCTCLKVLDLACSLPGLQPTQARRFLGLNIKSDGHFTSNALLFQSTPELPKKRKKEKKEEKKSDRIRGP